MHHKLPLCGKWIVHSKCFFHCETLDTSNPVRTMLSSTMPIQLFRLCAPKLALKVNSYVCQYNKKKTIKQTIQSLINYFTHNSICVAHISGEHGYNNIEKCTHTIIV